MNDIQITRSENLAVQNDSDKLGEALAWLQTHKTETAITAAAIVGGVVVASKFAGRVLGAGESESVQILRQGKHSVDLSLPNLSFYDLNAVKSFSGLAQTDARAMDARLELRKLYKLGFDSDAQLLKGVVQGSVDYVQGRTGNAYSAFLNDRFGKYVVDKSDGASRSALLASLNKTSAVESARDLNRALDRTVVSGLEIKLPAK